MGYYLDQFFKIEHPYHMKRMDEIYEHKPDKNESDMEKTKMPDKIYIHGKDNPLEITWSETEEKGCTNIEYIRKTRVMEIIEDAMAHLNPEEASPLQYVHEKINKS